MTALTFLSDLAAGITVVSSAWPPAIGFAIARRGTIAGIVDRHRRGFLISALGGSLVQVGGPTGAFVPILFGSVAKFGYDGLWWRR